MSIKFKNINFSDLYDENSNLDNLQQDFLKEFYVIKSEFSQFFILATEVLKEVTTTISEKIDTDPNLIQNLLLKSVSLYYTVGQFVADAKTFCLIYEIIHYCPKKAKFSEADRKTYVNTRIIIQNNLFMQLKNAEEKIEKRITVLQSILKAEVIRMQKENIMK